MFLFEKVDNNGNRIYKEGGYSWKAIAMIEIVAFLSEITPNSFDAGTKFVL